MFSKKTTGKFIQVCIVVLFLFRMEEYFRTEAHKVDLCRSTTSQKANLVGYLERYSQMTRLRVLRGRLKGETISLTRLYKTQHLSVYTPYVFVGSLSCQEVKGRRYWSLNPRHVIDKPRVSFKEQLAYIFRKQLMTVLQGGSQFWFPLFSSIWLGSIQYLEPEFKSLIRLSGMSHFFALSGYHVVLLILCLTGLIKGASFVFPRLYFWSYRSVRCFFAMFVSLFLCCTSGFVPSVSRVWCVLMIWGVVKYYGYYVTPVSLLAQSAIFLGILFPQKLMSLSAVLSFSATWVILFFFSRRNEPFHFWDGVKFHFLMPLIMSPLIFYLFSSFCPYSPLVNVVVGLLWGLVVGPFVFIGPIVFSFLPSHILNNFDTCFHFYAEPLYDFVVSSVDFFASSQWQWEMSIFEMGIIYLTCYYLYQKSSLKTAPSSRITRGV